MSIYFCFTTINRWFWEMNMRSGFEMCGYKGNFDKYYVFKNNHVGKAI